MKSSHTFLLSFIIAGIATGCGQAGSSVSKLAAGGGSSSSPHGSENSAVGVSVGSGNQFGFTNSSSSHSQEVTLTAQSTLFLSDDAHSAVTSAENSDNRNFHSTISLPPYADSRSHLDITDERVLAPLKEGQISITLSSNAVFRMNPNSRIHVLVELHRSTSELPDLRYLSNVRVLRTSGDRSSVLTLTFVPSPDPTAETLQSLLSNVSRIAIYQL